jgi:hAT family C-terminal dimerisation region
VSQPQVNNSLLQNIFGIRHRRGRQRDEIEKYMMIEEVDVNICPFKWWASQALNFPILSELAKKYLAIPATSASSERLFSDVKNVMTVRHTNLLPSTFKHLIFCKPMSVFYQYIISINFCDICN